MTKHRSYPAAIVGYNIYWLCRLRGISESRILKCMDWSRERYEDVCVLNEGTVDDDECERAAALLKTPIEILIGTHGVDGQPVSGTGEPLLPLFLTKGDPEVERRLQQVIRQLTGNEDFSAVGQWLVRTLPNLQNAGAEAILKGRRRIDPADVDKILKGLSNMAKKSGRQTPQEAEIFGDYWTKIKGFVRGSATPVIERSGSDSQLVEEVVEHHPPALATALADADSDPTPQDGGALLPTAEKAVEETPAEAPADDVGEVNVPGIVAIGESSDGPIAKPEKLAPAPSTWVAETISPEEAKTTERHTTTRVSEEALPLSVTEGLNSQETSAESQDLAGKLRRLTEDFQAFAKLAEPRLAASELMNQQEVVGLDATVAAILLRTDSLDLQVARRMVTGIVDRAFITEAMSQAGGNKMAASRLLGVDYKTARNLMKKHGIQHVQG